MGINSRGSDSFLQGLGASFPQQDVVVVSNPGQADESRQTVRAQVQSSKAFFDVDAPVYEGNALELSDPRGGVRTVYVTDVKINDMRGGTAFAGMSHLAVSFTSRAPETSRSNTPMLSGNQTFHGPVVIVTGGQANVAWDGGHIDQSTIQQVTAGFEELASAVGEALKLLASDQGIDPDDRGIADEAGTCVLQEVVKPDPDKGLIKRSLAILRGVLTSATQAASSETAKQLIGQLFA